MSVLTFILYVVITLWLEPITSLVLVFKCGKCIILQIPYQKSSEQKGQIRKLQVELLKNTCKYLLKCFTF